MQKYKTIPDLFSSREAAAMCGIAPTTLKYHARRNQIGFFQIANGKQLMYLFAREDITRFKKGQKPIDPAKR